MTKQFNFDIDLLENAKILASTNNEFKFQINSKNKIKDLNLKSKINFKEIFWDFERTLESGELFRQIQTVAFREFLLKSCNQYT